MTDNPYDSPRDGTLSAEAPQRRVPTLLGLLAWGITFAIAGGTYYLGLAIVIETRLLPQWIEPGQPTISYGVLAVLVMLPCTVALSAAFGVSLYMAWLGRWYATSAISLGSGILAMGGAAIAWLSDIQQGDANLSALGLYGPIMLLALVVLLVGGMACLTSIRSLSRRKPLSDD